jgi:hypothetical protein
MLYYNHRLRETALGQKRGESDQKVTKEKQKNSKNNT